MLTSIENQFHFALCFWHSKKGMQWASVHSWGIYAFFDGEQLHECLTASCTLKNNEFIKW